MTGLPLANTAGEHAPRVVDRSAAQWWTATACLAFTFAMAYAIAVVVFRLPVDGLGNGHLFRIALAMHVELAVFFWLMATAAAEWSASRPAVNPMPAALAALGTVIVALAPLAGGTPLMADYFPWLAGNSWFAAGFLIFCLAILWAAFGAIADGRGDVWRPARASAWPAIIAALTVLSDHLNGAEGLAELVWGGGHALLFSHVALMCWEWSRLTGMASSLARRVVALLVVTSVVFPVLPFVFSPGSSSHHDAFTWTMVWLLWPAAIAVGLRIVWQWRRGPVVPALAALVFPVSFALFVIGCGLGALIDGPTTLVTAHYHAAMGAVAISRMGMAYREWQVLGFGAVSLNAARRQLLVYAGGLVFLTAGLAIAAVDAAPRKTAAAEHRFKGPLYGLGMSISGVGGLLAMVGSSWLVINLLGRRHRREAKHAD